MSAVKDSLFTDIRTRWKENQQDSGYLMRDKNVIVIARQLNTIVNADQILVLQDGNLSERGTHCELFKCGGWYARVIAEQAKTKEWKIQQSQS